MARRSQPPDYARPLVWVLEDSELQAVAIKQALHPLFQVISFMDSPSIVEALAIAQPDVLVLDWHVPQISGLEVLHFVRQAHDEVTLPVLILTASTDQAADMLEALDAGANDFAAKPIGVPELRARVSTLLRVRRLHDRVLRAELLLEQAVVRAEAERNLLTAVLEHAPVGILVADASGRVVVANRRVQVELRQSLDTSVLPDDYSTWPGYRADGTPLASHELPTSCALRGEETHADELAYHFADGGMGTLQVSYGPVRDKHGNISAAVVVFQDITERKLEALKRQRRAEFEQQLIGIVSHDLRTPLGAISLGAAILSEDSSLTERQAKLVSRLVSSAGRASRMITDLLDFTAVRFGAGLPIKLAPVELHELTRRVTGEIQLASASSQHIELRGTGDARGTWDADRLAQLLVNLISNALHYSPSESTVLVDVRGEAETVVIHIHNDGAPIPVEFLPRLFLPMQRGQEDIGPNRRSVGLGLFIVDEIVRAHQGAITVHSTHEEGTSFTVSLPRSPLAPPPILSRRP
jgi:sigma-B regulation protein RsbU (phosphoserine phosphatase)